MNFDMITTYNHCIFDERKPKSNRWDTDGAFTVRTFTDIRDFWFWFVTRHFIVFGASWRENFLILPIYHTCAFPFFSPNFGFYWLFIIARHLAPTCFALGHVCQSYYDGAGLALSPENKLNHDVNAATNSDRLVTIEGVPTALHIENQTKTMRGIYVAHIC